MGNISLYLFVMRVEPSVQSLPGGVESEFTVTVTEDDTGDPISGVELTLTGGDCLPCVETTGPAGAPSGTAPQRPSPGGTEPK